MYAQKEKSKENKNRAVASSVAQKKNGVKKGVGFVDNCHEAAAQRKLQEVVSDSPSITQDPIQCLRINPAVNTMVITNGPVNAVSTDNVAPGPAHTWEYRASHPPALAPAVNKMGALQNIRLEYRSIGAGIVHPFLSVARATNLANNNNVMLNRMYVRYAGQGYVAPHVNASILDDTPAHQITRKRDQIIPLFNDPAMLDEIRNIPALTMTDPLRVKLEAMHAAGTIAHTVEFSEGQKGYISKVEDTQSNIDSTIVDRPNYAGEYPIADAAPYHLGGFSGGAKIGARLAGMLPGDSPRFSNVHHTATNTDVGTQIGGIGGVARISKEAGIDAMTKVVAEGGRFNCVAALQGAVQNNSLFFSQHPGGGYRVMEFRELWKKWTRYFGGGYGVTDAVVQAALLHGAAPRAGITHQDLIPAATGHNYDLDASAIR